jgi:GNAT superfamily N-acetyltransferase
MAIYAGGRFGEITELYVSPAHRSKGIAPILITAATSIGRQKGWKRLEVGAPDQPAWSRTLSFYLREGFEEVGPRLRKFI